MAERMVILRFEDPDAAQSFVMNNTLASQLGYEPKAMFVVPTKFCECPDKKRQHVNNWRRGKRTGIQLCVTCRRPSRFHTEGIMRRLEMVFGFNQLAVEHERE